MKKLSLVLAIVGFYLGQAQFIGTLEDQFLKNSTKFGDMELAGDKVEGSPFVQKKWTPAEIITQDGKKVYFNEANFLVTKNKFLVRYNDEMYEIFPEKAKVIFFQREDGKKMIIMPVDPAKVVPPVKDRFYEVFTADPEKVYVLKRYHKKKERKDVSQSYASDKSSVKMQYRQKEHFYVFNGKVYVKTKPKLKSIVSVLKDRDHYKDLKQFVKSNRLKLRNGYDLQRLMMYYFNELK